MAHRKLRPEQEKEAAAMYAEGQTAHAVAQRFGVCSGTMRDVLHRQEAPMRGGGRRAAPPPIEEMTALYRAGATQEEIAQRFKTSAEAVSRDLAIAGVTPRYKNLGERHGHWKGGRFISNDIVYILVRADSPFASMRNRSSYVMEHRLVMAQHLGRPLLRSETVHHKNNNDTMNNDLLNLQLRQGRHGKGAVFRCADCGSHNVHPASLAEGAPS
jgi:hypothetical protein